MSDTNSSNQNEKATKVRRKPERESVLTPTFAVARQTTPDRQQSQPSGGGLLQRQCSCGKHTIAGGVCEECQQKGEATSSNVLDEFGSAMPPDIQTTRDTSAHFNLNHISVQTGFIANGQPLQPALTVNAPGDQYEQEANHVAEAVMRMSAPRPASPSTEIDSFVHPTVSRLPAISRIQISGGNGAFQTPSHVEARINQMQGRGQSLPDSERDFFESRMGYDFSQVRIHTDSNAVQASRDIQAKAFTVGNNIAFNAEAYQPGTDAGRRLLAHELTHVVQQTRDSKGKIQRLLSPENTHLFLKNNENVICTTNGQLHFTHTTGSQAIIQRQFTLDEAAAIAHNRNAIGGNAQFIRVIRFLLHQAVDESLPVNNNTIDEAFVRAIALFQENRRLPRPHDGKINSRTRRALASDLKGILPGTRSRAAPRALQAAQNIVDIYTNENILFAWWAGDCRDNNKNNRFDSGDPSERDKGDGWPRSHNRTFRGFKTIRGTCRHPAGNVTTTAFETDAPVKYKVCADIVSQAYRQAGIMSSTVRSVVRILRFFQHSGHCDVWRFGQPGFPETYLPGDFICSVVGSHGHAGMVINQQASNSGTQRPVVVHLPGASVQIRRGDYDPTRTSDVRMEPWPRPMHFLGRSRR